MPKATTNNNLVQGTLSFATTKRATTQNVKRKPSHAKTLQTLRKSSSSSSEDEVDVDDIKVPSSDEELVKEQHPTISRSTKTKATREPKKQVEKVTNTLPTKNSVADREPIVLPELNENNPAYRKHYVGVREKMGCMQPLHAHGQGRIHEILRVFDMSYEYGPCVGVSRLDRWERAHALGLNPSPEVKEILSTRQGTEQEEFSQSVLSNRV